MQIERTALDGVLILEPRVFGDARGYFFESFNKAEFDAMLLREFGRTVEFVQDNESMSRFGVVRGLHYQRPPFAQSKLVRCVRGCVLDVMVDIRKGSPTFGRHISVELSAENRRMCFIPRGFAHGFSVLSPEAVFQYKCDNFYKPESEGGINPMDPSLGIDWRITAESAMLSQKDLQWQGMAQIPDDFAFGEILY